MGASLRWLAPVAALAATVGAVVALSPGWRKSASVTPGGGTVAVTVVTAPAPASADEQATKQVVDAAGRLGVAVERAKQDVSKATASSLAALKRSRAEVSSERERLARQQAQLTSEAEQLSGRATELAKQSAALQQQADALRAAEARFAAQASAQAGLHRGEGHDD